MVTSFAPKCRFVARIAEGIGGMHGFSEIQAMSAGGSGDQ
jgi:hypothetical protein